MIKITNRNGINFEEAIQKQLKENEELYKELKQKFQRGTEPLAYASAMQENTRLAIELLKLWNNRFGLR